MTEVKPTFAIETHSAIDTLQGAVEKRVNAPDVSGVMAKIDDLQRMANGVSTDQEMNLSEADILVSINNSEYNRGEYNSFLWHMELI
jgi:hypothetical protein